MTETPDGDSEQAFLDQAVVIALGSNLPGDYSSSCALLDAALKALDEHGLKVVRASSWWRSQAWPKGAGPDFINGVALVETELSPEAVLARLHEIETAFGRERAQLNTPRTLDLDLIAHGRIVIQTADLTVPHPRAAERRFVMGPLSEIAASWRHPGRQDNAADLADRAPIGADAQSQAKGTEY